MQLPRVLVSISLCAALGAQKEADAKAEPGPGAPRGEVVEWTSAQGQPYWYRLPKKIDKRDPPALILMLHGTGVGQGWAFWNYPIAAGRFRPDDIIVAPEGMTPGHGDTFNFVQGKKDGEQLAGIIRRFRDKLPVGRVYVYGHSQGAFFCYWFAGAYPELVDGIVAHAGNVLQVDHPKLAKEKVAIGILHGKADAVVPVECAYRTEKIYREQGYKLLKLYVVEGLTERSGHWPLPVQVGEMLDWLDQVTASTPMQAIEAAASLVARRESDLAAVADALRRAVAQLKKARGEEAAAMRARLETLQDFLAWNEEAHVEALQRHAAATDAKAEFGAWAAQFRAAHRALHDRPGWSKSLKVLTTRAGKHDKQIDKAIKRLSRPDHRAFKTAAKAVEEAFLSTRYAELRGQLLRLAERPPKRVKPSQVEALRALVEQRAEAEAEGRKAAGAATASAAKRFADAHPDVAGGK